MEEEIFLYAKSLPSDEVQILLSDFDAGRRTLLCMLSIKLRPVQRLPLLACGLTNYNETVNRLLHNMRQEAQSNSQCWPWRCKAGVCDAKPVARGRMPAQA
eukprot:1573419-Karenia_brevis.AAC.1